MKKRQLCENFREKQSRQREQYMQGLWGQNKLGMFKEEKEAQNIWSVVGEEVEGRT